MSTEEEYDTIENRIRRMGYRMDQPHEDDQAIEIRPSMAKMVTGIVAMIIGFILMLRLIPVLQYLTGQVEDLGMLSAVVLAIIGGLGVMSFYKGLERLFACSGMSVYITPNRVVLRKRQDWSLIEIALNNPTSIYSVADKEHVRLICRTDDGQETELLSEENSIVASKLVVEHMAKQLNTLIGKGQEAI